jgi:hypothetical protein
MNSIKKIPLYLKKDMATPQKSHLTPGYASSQKKNKKDTIRFGPTKDAGLISIFEKRPDCGRNLKPHLQKMAKNEHVSVKVRIPANAASDECMRACSFQTNRYQLHSCSRLLH